MEHTVLGERLHTVRRRQNLSQSDLAAKSGVTVTTISGIESRRVDVRGSTLRVLAQVLEVSTDYLLGICDDPEPCRTSRHPPTARASAAPAAEDQATPSAAAPPLDEEPTLAAALPARASRKPATPPRATAPRRPARPSRAERQG
jgi:transcriptional regulator with XRE-family HTH domain